MPAAAPERQRARCSKYLADGSDSPRRLKPSPVVGGRIFRSIGVTFNSTCALTGQGALFCWGGNDDGQLGTGSESNAATPTHIDGGLTLAQFDAGALHVCAVTTGHVGYRWGENLYGTRGNANSGVGVISRSPVRVSPPS